MSHDLPTPATRVETPPAPPGLADLSAVELSAANRLFLEQAHGASGGDPAWRARKKREATELLALSQIAPPGRLFVEALDMRESLRAVVSLGVPVPCRPNEKNELRLAKAALLGIQYPQEAVRQMLPGPAFVQILAPADVWLPQVRQPDQPLCLGVKLPAGIRVRSLVLMAYGALSMQAIQLDEFDSAGVFNSEAARWWQQNMRRVPLTRAAFLARDDAVLADGPAAALSRLKPLDLPQT